MPRHLPPAALPQLKRQAPPPPARPRPRLPHQNPRIRQRNLIRRSIPWPRSPSTPMRPPVGRLWTATSTTSPSGSTSTPAAVDASRRFAGRTRRQHSEPSTTTRPNPTPNWPDFRSGRSAEPSRIPPTARLLDLPGRQLDTALRQGVIGNLAEDVTDHVKPTTLLALVVDDVPRRPLGARHGEHLSTSAR